MLKRRFGFMDFFFGLFLGMVMPIMLCADGDDDPTGGGGGGGEEGGGEEGGEEGGGEEGGEEGGDKTEFVDRDELNKAIARRDAALKKSREATTKLKALESEMKGLKELVSKFDGAEERLAAADKILAAEEERRTAEMSEVDRLKHELEKAKGTQNSTVSGLQAQLKELQDTFSSEKEEWDKERGKLRGFQRDSIIRAAAATHGAVNPDQVVRLVGNEFKLNEDNEYVVERAAEGGGIVEVGVEEYIEGFLNDESNQNLVNKKRKPRKSHDPSGDPNSGAGDKKKNSPADYTLSAIEKKRAQMRGMTEKDYYEAVIKPQQDAEKRISERRKGDKKGGLPGQVRIPD